MRRGLVATVALVGLSGAVLATAPATAVQPVTHDVLSSTNPVNWTPHVLDGDVRAVTEVGDRVLVGGEFTRVSDVDGTTEYPRTHLFAFDAPSGDVVTSFAPSLPGMVYAIADAGDGRTAYVAGQFGNVNGASGTSRIARIDTTTGAVVSSFRSPGFNGIIKNLVIRGQKLYVGGTFTTAGGRPRTALALLDKNTGALDHSFDLTFSDPRNGGTVQVLKFDVSPDGSRLIAIGNFTKINGLDRYQAGMLDLTTTPVSVADWATQRFTTACSSSFDSYMRDVDFSPDGRYFVIVTTGAFSGGANAGTLCDTASRWDLPATGPDQQPSWVNYSGGDTFWSVGVAGKAVYVGGHFRWLNNPFSSDSAGQGAVERNGLAALDPRNGMPLSWNPQRTLGVGVFDLTATARGLWVGSDTDRIGDFEYHGRVALLPTNGGRPLPADFTGRLPSDVYSLGAGLTTNTVVRRGFTGSATSSSSALPADGTAWSTTRGAFMVDGVVYTGRTNGASGVFEARTFDGTTFGAPTTVDLNGLNAFASELNSMTGSFFDPETGRLYFTLAGQSSLFYRYFSPESRIVGGQRFTATGNLSDLNWTQVASMFQVGDHLYVASSVDSNLRRYSWVDAGPIAGNRPVAGTGTVVSGPTLDGQQWRARGAFAFAPLGGENLPPSASFTSECSGLTCVFSSTSTDPDGSIATAAWDFGNGSTGSGPSVAHAYAAAGTYTINLAVTDDDGATRAASGTVTVTVPATPVGFRSAAGSDTNASTGAITLPADVQAGDVMLLWATVNSTTPTVTPPTGWSTVATVPGSTMQSALFTRIATAGDAGRQVTVPLSAAAKVSLQLAAYSGSSGVAAQASAVESQVQAQHTTPVTTVPEAGSFVVSYWADKSSTTTAWSVPSAATARSSTLGTGSGRIASVVADSGVGVGAGPAGGLTATADSANSKAVMWTVVLGPS